MRFAKKGCGIIRPTSRAHLLLGDGAIPVAGCGNVVWMFEKYLLKSNENGVCPLTVQIGEVL